MSTPPLPAGYQLDQGSGEIPPLPAGYQLDSGEAKTPEPSGFWDTLKREGKSLVGTISGMPAGMYHAVAEPATPEEEKALGQKDPNRMALASYRLAFAPIHVAAQWYGDAARGKYGDLANVESQMLDVAPEAMGQAAAAPLTAKLLESLPEAAKGARDTARAVVKNTPPVIRAAAKGANVALAKAPGTIGAAAGGIAGAATRVPYGAEIGAGIGGMVGREILPKLRVPGEEFGLSPDATAENTAYAGERTPPASGAPDATRENRPYAGEPPPEPAPDATGENKPYAGEKSPPITELKAQSDAIVDKAIPPEGPGRADNLSTKAEVDFHLQRGETDAAHEAFQKATQRFQETLQQGERRNPELNIKYQGPERRAAQGGELVQGFDWSPAEDLGNKTRAQVEAKMGPIKRGGRPTAAEQAAPLANLPGYMARETPTVVPSVRNIRENLALQNAAESEVPPALRARPDIDEDRALSQEMNWDMEKHGYRAESEARREFIAKNSTGMTKGELTGQVAPAEDLSPAWQKALDEILRRKQAGQ